MGETVLPEGVRQRRRLSPRVGLIAALPIVGLGAAGAYAFESTSATPPPPAAARTVPAPATARVTPTPASTSAVPTATPGLPLAQLTASQIVDRAGGTLIAAGYVRTTTRTTSPSRGIADVTTVDSLPNRGLQTESRGKLYDSILVVPGATYVKADATTLAGTYGFSAANAKLAAGQWIEFTPTTTGYQEITDGITLPSIADETIPSGQLTKLAATTKQNRRVIGVAGTPPKSADLPAGSLETLWVALSGPPRPVEIDLSLPNDDTKAQVTFSDWDATPPTVEAPPTALTLIHDHSAVPTTTGA